LIGVRSDHASEGEDCRNPKCRYLQRVDLQFFCLVLGRRSPSRY
jgi:hypothetical protein